MAKRNTYKYQFKVGNKIVHGGITNDLERREQEHQQKWSKGHITQVGKRTTEDAARKWETDKGYGSRYNRHVVRASNATELLKRAGVSRERVIAIRGVLSKEGTISFHADAALKQRIKSEAKKRRIPVSRFVKEAVSKSILKKRVTGADLEGCLIGMASGKIDPNKQVLEPWNEDTCLFKRK